MERIHIFSYSVVLNWNFRNFLYEAWIFMARYACFRSNIAVFLSSILKWETLTKVFKRFKFNMKRFVPSGFGAKKMSDKNCPTQGWHFWIAPISKRWDRARWISCLSVANQIPCCGVWCWRNGLEKGIRYQQNNWISSYFWPFWNKELQSAPIPSVKCWYLPLPVSPLPLSELAGGFGIRLDTLFGGPLP